MAQFFAILKKNQNRIKAYIFMGTYIRLKIRKSKGRFSSCKCPLTVVCSLKGGPAYHLMEWNKAAKFLGMPHYLAVHIVKAADDPTGEKTTLRNRHRLIKVLGLA